MNRSRGRIVIAALLFAVPCSVCTLAQPLRIQTSQTQPAPPSQPPAPAIPSDPVLTAADGLIGEALFLRGFYTADALAYDATGILQGPAPRPADWTLSAINILKATRQGSDAVELEGVRAAIRYNPDAHEFQRHPQNIEKVRVFVRLADPGPNIDATAAAHQLRAAFAAIFAIGIDPALQRSMPPLWSHFFDPSLAWPPDSLTGQTIYPLFGGQPGQPQDVTPPVVAHRVDPQFTDAAARDRVTGPMQLRIVVDARGLVQHIVVAHPLGYGLEQQAADAVAKWRFDPATRQGQPVASAIVVNLNFDPTPPPR
jgi:TonB family protein